MKLFVTNRCPDESIAPYSSLITFELAAAAVAATDELILHARTLNEPFKLNNTVLTLIHNLYNNRTTYNARENSDLNLNAEPDFSPTKRKIQKVLLYMYKQLPRCLVTNQELL